MHDWLALVANAACADKPDHIRHNAVNAVRMAAQSLVSLAHSRRSADAGWNTLALRSGFMLFLVSDFFLLQEEPHQWANRKSKSSICFWNSGTLIVHKLTMAIRGVGSLTKLYNICANIEEILAPYGQDLALLTVANF